MPTGQSPPVPVPDTALSLPATEPWDPCTDQSLRGGGLGWVGISTQSFSGSTTDAQVTPSLYFWSLAHLELDTATLLGFIPASGNGRQFFWHYTEIQHFVPTCKVQQTSPQTTELLPWFLCVLVEPQPLWSCAGRWTLVAPTARVELSQAWKPQHRAAAQGLVLHLCWETGNTSNCFHFLTLFLLNTSQNRGHKEYPSSYICVS